MALFRSLRSRVFVATAAVSALALGLALGLVTSRAGREAEAELRRDLERAAGVLAEQQAARVEGLRGVARLVADLPKLKAALDTGDPATIRPIALDYLARARAALLFVSDRRGRVLVSVGRATAEQPDVTDALAGRDSARFEAAADGVVQIVTVPVTLEDETLGALGLGFVLDDAEAERFEATSDSQIAIVMDGRVRASTLPREHDGSLVQAARAFGVHTVRLGETDFVAVARPIDTEAGAPLVLLLRSRSERLGFLRTLRDALLAAALLAALLAILLSWGVARSVTRPLSALTSAMREMARTGDRPRLPEAGRFEDEDAALLAQTFDGLLASLERFQREAALRDRLSALGRLSTVIAHEVRNPLMSIKASLTALREPGLDPARVREAASDIDHEVARLNRIVGDVLDFARPVRVEYARVDVNALAREAALSMLPAEAVGFDLESAPLEAETDPDWLRAALVNVLQNARDAASERAGSGEPAVLVRTRAQGDRLELSVLDRGPGIADDHRPHVFEPYFTTKRSGTGLGLAIAKNVIDALRGTIAALPREGGGTEIRIQLLREPPPGVR